MTARALPWFEDEDPRDIWRWAIAALIVLCIHLGAIAGYLHVRQPDDIGDESPAVAVEVSPSDDTVDQAEVTPVPEQEQKQVEEEEADQPAAERRTRGGHDDSADIHLAARVDEENLEPSGESVALKK